MKMMAAIRASIVPPSKPWVRIASSVQWLVEDQSEDRSALGAGCARTYDSDQFVSPHHCTLEAMRTRGGIFIDSWRRNAT
jgi:hypothetical protein